MGANSAPQEYVADVAEAEADQPLQVREALSEAGAFEPPLALKLTV